jgi:hypothetical protein
MRGHLLGDEESDEFGVQQQGGEGGGRTGCCGVWRRWAEAGYDTFAVVTTPPSARGAFATIVLYPIVFLLFFVILLGYRYAVPVRSDALDDLTGACAPAKLQCTSRTGCVLAVGGSIPPHAAGIGWVPSLSSNTRRENPGVFDASGLRAMAANEVLELQLCAGAGEFVDVASRDVALVPAGGGAWTVNSWVTLNATQSVLFPTKQGTATVQPVTWEADGGFALQNPASVAASFAAYSPVVLSGGSGPVWTAWEGAGGSACANGAENAWLVQASKDGASLTKTSVAGASGGSAALSTLTAGLVPGSAALQTLVPCGMAGAVAVAGQAAANGSALFPAQLSANIWWGNGSVTRVVELLPLPPTMEVVAVRAVPGVDCGAQESAVVVAGGDGDVVLADLNLVYGFFVRAVTIARSGGGANLLVATSTEHTWVFTGGAQPQLVVLQRSSYVVLDSLALAPVVPGNASHIDVFATSGDVLYALVDSFVCVFALRPDSNKIGAHCSAVFPVEFAVSWALQPVALIPSPVKPGDCLVAYNVRDPLAVVGGTWTTPPTLVHLAGGGILAYMDSTLSVHVGDLVATVNDTLTLPVTGIAEDGEMTSLQPFVTYDERSNRKTQSILLAAPEEFNMGWPCPQTLNNYTSCIRVNLASTGITQSTTFGLSWLQVIANLIGGISGLFVLLRYTVVTPPFLSGPGCGGAPSDMDSKF